MSNPDINTGMKGNGLRVLTLTAQFMETLGRAYSCQKIIINLINAIVKIIHMVSTVLFSKENSLHRNKGNIAILSYLILLVPDVSNPI